MKGVVCAAAALGPDPKDLEKPLSEPAAEAGRSPDTSFKRRERRSATAASVVRLRCACASVRLRFSLP